MSVDITLALTAHSETIVAGPTMHSAAAAVTAAQKAGYSVECLMGLDRASQETETYFMQPAFDNWQRLELDCGDLGLARNALSKAASGRFIAFLDADDLLSENWLLQGARMLDKAAKDKRQMILHPELNWFFDAAQSILANDPDDGPLHAPLYWRVANYYDSLAMAPREAFLSVPYADRDHENRLGYEDWRWNLETSSAGWAHQIVPDTIIFKRRRDVSMLSELGEKKTLLWDLPELEIGAS